MLRLEISCGLLHKANVISKLIFRDDGMKMNCDLLKKNKNLTFHPCKSYVLVLIRLRIAMIAGICCMVKFSDRGSWFWILGGNKWARYHLLYIPGLIYFETCLFILSSIWVHWLLTDMLHVTLVLVHSLDEEKRYMFKV